MKIMMRLILVVLALLLVTNMAFAQCDLEVCYDVTQTYEGGSSIDMTWFVCLNDDGTGNIDGSTLAWFGGGPNTASFDMVPLWWQAVVSGGVNGVKADISGDVIKADNGIGDMSGHIWTTGDSMFIHGVFQDYGNRYIVKGQKVDCEPVPSDERYKKEIQPLGSSLDNVMQLRGVSFSWRTEEYKGRGFKEGREIGLIAQEVERVYPELVTTDGNGYKAVFYNKLVPVLIEAIKEQQKDIKEKDVRIKRLEMALEIMEKRIAAIESHPRTLVLK